MISVLLQRRLIAVVYKNQSIYFTEIYRLIFRYNSCDQLQLSIIIYKWLIIFFICNSYFYCFAEFFCRLILVLVDGS